MFSNESITVNMSNLFNKPTGPAQATTASRHCLDVTNDSDEPGGRKTSTDQSVDLVSNLSSILSTNGKMSSVILCHFDFSISGQPAALANNTTVNISVQEEEPLNVSTPIRIQTSSSNTLPKQSIMKQPLSSGVKNSQSSSSVVNLANQQQQKANAAERRDNFYKTKKYNLSYDLGYSSAQNRKNLSNAAATNYESFSTSFYNDEAAVKSSSNSILDLRSLVSGGGGASSAGGARRDNLKLKKLRKSDISSPVSFNHVTHLDKPVAIGKRYKVNY
jgi:hypothetical protein